MCVEHKIVFIIEIVSNFPSHIPFIRKIVDHPKNFHTKHHHRHKTKHHLNYIKIPFIAKAIKHISVHNNAEHPTMGEIEFGLKFEIVFQKYVNTHSIQQKKIYFRS
jgi:hypothetical protein